MGELERIKEEIGNIELKLEEIKIENKKHHQKAKIVSKKIKELKSKQKKSKKVKKMEKLKKKKVKKGKKSKLKKKK